MRRLMFPLGLMALLIPGISCVKSEVTPIGRTYPPLPVGCHVAVFPATRPDSSYEDVASARAECHATMGRTACIDELRAKACQVGADTVYAFSEGIHGEYTLISATLGRRSKAVASTPAPTGGDSTAGGCSPLCSPGFLCDGAICQPQCNPRCEAGETCTRKRVCEPIAKKP